MSILIDENDLIKINCCNKHFMSQEGMKMYFKRTKNTPLTVMTPKLAGSLYYFQLHDRKYSEHKVKKIQRQFRLDSVIGKRPTVEVMM